MPDARCQMPDGMAADNSVGGRRYPWTRKRLSDHTARCSWSLNWRSKRLQCDSGHGSTAPPTSPSLLGSRHAWAFPALPNFLFRPNRTPRKEVVQLTLPSLPLSCLHPPPPPPPHPHPHPLVADGATISSSSCVLSHACTHT